MSEESQREKADNYENFESFEFDEFEEYESYDASKKSTFQRPTFQKSEPKSSSNFFNKSLTKYIDFKGRASIGEYWSILLIGFLVFMTFRIIELTFYFDYLGGIIAFVLATPWLAVGVRRLHDVNLSGWFVVAAFIPKIGIWLVVLLGLIPGSKSDNKYGPNPKK